MGHRRPHRRNAGVVECHRDLAVEDLERRAVQVLDDFVVRREALVDKGVQVLADRLAPVPVGNAEVAYGVFCEAVPLAAGVSPFRSS